MYTIPKVLHSEEWNSVFRYTV